MSDAAERMRRSRKRRRDGQRCVTVVVLDREIAALVTHGLLDPVARNDRHAIAAALGKLLDQLPPECWDARLASSGLVSLKLNSSFIDHLVTLGWLLEATPRDRATIKAGLVGFIQRACALSGQAPYPFRADMHATGGRSS
jgi:hypothetical protein